MKLLSVSVMAHPSREKWFSHLKDRLGDVPFAIDRGLGIWDTCRRAWEMHDPDAKYHVVIQDDAIVCRGFQEKAEAFIRQHDAENRAFGFYFGNKKTLRQQAASALKVGYAVKITPSWGVAICLPTSYIPDMIEQCNEMNNKQDDVRIGRFITSRKMQVYFPMPSLVDHRVGHKSLVGDPGKGRRAYYFIDRP